MPARRRIATAWRVEARPLLVCFVRRGSPAFQAIPDWGDHVCSPCKCESTERTTAHVKSSNPIVFATAVLARQSTTLANGTGRLACGALSGDCDLDRSHDRTLPTQTKSARKNVIATARSHKAIISVNAGAGGCHTIVAIPSRRVCASRRIRCTR